MLNIYLCVSNPYKIWWLNLSLFGIQDPYLKNGVEMCIEDEHQDAHICQWFELLSVTWNLVFGLVLVNRWMDFGDFHIGAMYRECPVDRNPLLHESRMFQRLQTGTLNMLNWVQESFMPFMDVDNDTHAVLLVWRIMDLFMINHIQFYRSALYFWLAITLCNEVPMVDTSILFTRLGLKLDLWSPQTLLISQSTSCPTEYCKTLNYSLPCLLFLLIWYIYRKFWLKVCN